MSGERDGDEAGALRANILFVLPDVLNARAEQIAAHVDSLLTNALLSPCERPGVVVMQDGDGARELMDGLQFSCASRPPLRLPLEEIVVRYVESVERLRSIPGVRLAAHGESVTAANEAAETLFQVDASAAVQHAWVLRGQYGPTLLVVSCADEVELSRLVASLVQVPAATIYGTPLDRPHALRLAQQLSHRCARISSRLLDSRTIAAGERLYDDLHRFTRGIGGIATS
ncbi:hypothetical protein [Labilithrix luteola]|uniref:hypothetical protein n=1 Tax=Labilithrix luteola TaxID=1391654 RepID=UPI001475CDE5|nr:hypothetical protein [Labilithrix luteola]